MILAKPKSDTDEDGVRKEENEDDIVIAMPPFLAQWLVPLSLSGEPAIRFAPKSQHRQWEPEGCIEGVVWQRGKEYAFMKSNYRRHTHWQRRSV